MQVNSSEERLIDGLNVIYDAETRFLEAQEHAVRQVRSGSLMSMLVQHINKTQQQLKNLKLVFRLIDRKPKSIASEAVTALIAEAQNLMQQTAIQPEILQAVMIEAHIKMKAFEIYCYRNLIAEIEQIGQTVILCLIIKNLQQEEQILERAEQYFHALPCLNLEQECVSCGQSGYSC
jgi:ferritin-like metal-binding protein YciE